MRLKWKQVDQMRKERGLSKARLARLADMSESTIHKGLADDATLKKRTEAAIIQAFAIHAKQLSEAAE